MTLSDLRILGLHGIGGSYACRLDNIPQLEGRREVLLLHKPGIDQLPFLLGIFELNLK